MTPLGSLRLFGRFLMESASDLHGAHSIAVMAWFVMEYAPWGLSVCLRDLSCMSTARSNPPVCLRNLLHLFDRNVLPAERPFENNAEAPLPDLLLRHNVFKVEFRRQPVHSCILNQSFTSSITNAFNSFCFTVGSFAHSKPLMREPLIRCRFPTLVASLKIRP